MCMVVIYNQCSMFMMFMVQENSTGCSIPRSYVVISASKSLESIARVLLNCVVCIQSAYSNYIYKIHIIYIYTESYCKI